jgi:DNA modification methylase
VHNQILCGDALAVLKTLPSNYVQCVVTSPPYYGLRDYQTSVIIPTRTDMPDCRHKWVALPPESQYKAYCEICDAFKQDQQIGIEETPEQYVQKLTAVFREVRRVLRDDGTLWLNLGDSYARSNSDIDNKMGSVEFARPSRTEVKRPPHGIPDGIRPKNLLGIPWKVAFSLQADGWILRQDLIWEKPNTMPESVKDRCTKSHEYVFLLAKSEKYFYDAEAIKVPSKQPGRTRTIAGLKTRDIPLGDPNYRSGSEQWRGSITDSETRNARSVWSIATRACKDAHFAVMAPELARRCILAGSAEKGCEYCGTAWDRIVEHTPMVIGPKAGSYGSRTTDGLSGTMVSPSETHTVGFEPGCMCDNIGSGKSIVLDPFSGAGTTAYVASKLGRQYIGIELNPQYVELSQKRLGNLTAGLWGFDEEIA